MIFKTLLNRFLFFSIVLTSILAFTPANAAKKAVVSTTPKKTNPTAKEYAAALVIADSELYPEVAWVDGMRQNVIRDKVRAYYYGGAPVADYESPELLEIIKGLTAEEDPNGVGFRGIREHHRTLPEPIIIEHPYESADQLIDTIYLNETIDSEQAFVKAGQDLNAVLTQNITDFVDNKGRWSKYSRRKNLQKELMVVFYHIDDAAFVDALHYAKDNNVKISIVTDLNAAIHLNNKYFPTGKSYSSDFTAASSNDNAANKQFTRLMKGGFAILQVNPDDVEKISNAPSKNNKIRTTTDTEHLATVSSPPLNDFEKLGNTPTSIMHEKELIMMLRDHRGRLIDAVALEGTHNLTLGSRVNRIIRYSCPIYARLLLDHAQRLKNKYSTGGLKVTNSSKAPEPPTPPHRFVFRNGEFMEVAFTDGRWELNASRIGELLLQSALHTDKYRVKDVIISDFAPTNTIVTHLLEELKRVQQEMGITVVTDAKFTDPSAANWAILLALANFKVSRPAGRHKVKKLPKSLSEFVNFYVYLRRDGNKKELDPEGYPYARHMWHDKTKIILREEKEVNPRTGKTEWVEYFHIFSGSYNLSLADRNNEMQNYFKVRADTSAFGIAMKRTFHQMLESSKEHLLHGEKAGFHVFLSLFLSKTPLEISTERVEVLIENIQNGNLKAVYSEIELMMGEHSETAVKLPLAIKDDRLDRLKRFIDWYAKIVPSGNAGMPTQKFTSVLTGILGDMDWIVRTNVYGQPKTARAMESLIFKHKARQKGYFYDSLWRKEWANFDGDNPKGQEEYEKRVQEACDMFAPHESVLNTLTKLQEDRDFIEKTKAARQAEEKITKAEHYKNVKPINAKEKQISTKITALSKQITALERKLTTKATALYKRSPKTNKGRIFSYTLHGGRVCKVNLDSPSNLKLFTDYTELLLLITTPREEREKLRTQLHEIKGQLERMRIATEKKITQQHKTAEDKILAKFSSARNLPPPDNRPMVNIRQRIDAEHDRKAQPARKPLTKAALAKLGKCALMFAL